MRTLVVLAVVSLAYAKDDHLALKHELKSIPKDSHPKLLHSKYHTPILPNLGNYDDEFSLFEDFSNDELGKNLYNSIGSFTKQHGTSIWDILFGFDEESDSSDNENFLQGVTSFLKKNTKLLNLQDENDSYEDHQLGFLQGVTDFLKKNGNIIMRAGAKLDDFESEEEFFNLGNLLQDAFNKHNSGVINDGIQMIKSIGKQDNNEDNSLFNLRGLVKDSLEIYEDAHSKNYGHGGKKNLRH